MAEWLRSGLQNRLPRFNSGRGLQQNQQVSDWLKLTCGSRQRFVSKSELPLPAAKAPPRLSLMALSEKDRAKLDQLGIENVKLKLAYAGPGPQSAVPGLGPGLDMTRGDIEEWLAEQSPLG